MKNISSRLLYGYLVFLGIFSLGMGIWVFVAPNSFIEIAGLTLEGTGKDLTLFLFSARNLAFGVLFIIGLTFFYERSTLITILIGRLTVDTFDITGMALADGFTLGVVEFISVVFVFILPTLFCIGYLLRSQTSQQLA